MTIGLTCKLSKRPRPCIPGSIVNIVNERLTVPSLAAAAIMAVLHVGCRQEGEGSRPAPAVEKGGLEQALALTAADILGNPEYTAFCYGGYRGATRDEVPTVDHLKEDMRILSAIGVKLVRTYNTQQFAHASRLLEAIAQLRDEDPGFEMFVMLGAWIECEGAWTPGE